MYKPLSSFPLSVLSSALHSQLARASLVVFCLQTGTAFAQADLIQDKDMAQAVVEPVQAVIVTGTRRSGLKAIDSASPIQVLDAGALERAGQPDLIQALAQNIPSFTAQAFGSDTANLTLSARLRGLSPNNTLVLVNGKRRHTTANLAVLGGPYQGAAAADHPHGGELHGEDGDLAAQRPGAHHRAPFEKRQAEGEDQIDRR